MPAEQSGFTGYKRGAIGPREKGAHGLFDEFGAAALLRLDSGINLAEEFLGQCDRSLYFHTTSILPWRGASVKSEFVAMLKGRGDKSCMGWVI